MHYSVNQCMTSWLAPCNSIFFADILSENGICVLDHVVAAIPMAIPSEVGAWLLLFFVSDLFLIQALFSFSKLFLGLPKTTGEKVFSATLYKRWSCSRTQLASTLIRLVSFSCDGTLWFFGPLFADLIWAEPAAWSLLVHCFLAPAVAELFVKSIFKRPRPTHNTRHFFLAPGEKYSFPSGHSTRAHAIATFETLSALHTVSASTFGFVLCAHLWAVAISYSRVAMGRHYPSDVIAGHITGTLTSIVSREMLHLDERVRPPWQHLRNILLSMRFAN